MEVFISWSKNKSRLLALATKGFIRNVFGKKIEVFFSPDMYKGTSGRERFFPKELRRKENLPIKYLPVLPGNGRCILLSGRLLFVRGWQGY